MSSLLASRQIFPRLMKMSGDEIQTRVRQELRKRSDLARYYLGFSFGSKAVVSPTELRGRFFFDPDDLPKLVELLRSRLPDEAAATIEEANRTCRHQFDLLGYQNLQYGPKIDWYLDAVHGKRAPGKPWFRISYLRNQEVGDHKVVWELNRHQHLVKLAQAYWLTGEDRFILEILAQFRHWWEQNPYPMGVNWASSLEVAIRSLSWLWVRYCLTGSSAVPNEFSEKLLLGLYLNGRHIERFLSSYFSPNTHLLGEGVALFFIGTLCPELPAAPHWQERGWEIVQRESERQVGPDGAHFEQSVYYHVYALDLFLHARILAYRNRIAIPADFDRTIERMLEYLLALAQAGRLPRLGDDDGGRIFNPRRNHTAHLMDPLATGAVLFRRPDFKAVACGIKEETLYLLGAEGLAQFDEIPPIRPAISSKRFGSSGICLMASPEPAPRQLVVDAGPFGPGTGGHGHADALSVQMIVDGDDLLTDPGTFAYVSEGNERDRYRSTAAHNTLQVDGISQADPTGPFAWRSLPEVQVDRWVAGHTFDLFAGSHTGYGRLPEPVEHRRWVFGPKSRFWLVRDVALGQGMHDLVLSWHLAPGLRTQNHGTKVGAFFRGHRQGVAVLTAEGHGWLERITQGRVSPIYGREEPSLVLQFRTRTLLPAEFATLLLPSGASEPEAGTLELISGEERTGTPKVYRYSNAEGSHYMVFAGRGSRWIWGSWASDAEFLYLHMDTRVRRSWIICGGSYVDIDGERALEFKENVDCFEWTLEGAEAEIFCSNEQALSHLSADALTLEGALSPTQGNDKRS